MKSEILRAKQNYKEKLETNMAASELGSAWSSMKCIAGISSPNLKNGSTVTLEGFDADFDLENALNSFYSSILICNN